MIGELAYWMFYYVMKVPRVKREKTGISDSLFLLSIVALVNILTVMILIELAGWHGLTDLWNSFLGTVKWSRSNILSWVYALILLIPLLWINWRLFYRPAKFREIRERCEKMGGMRRIIGKSLFWLFVVGSHVVFGIAIKQKNPPGDKEYRDRLEEIRELKNPLDQTGEKTKSKLVLLTDSINDTVEQ